MNIGISPCPNDVFVFSGLILRRVGSPDVDFRFHFEDIETLNRRAQTGDFDLVKISYANYRNCDTQYILLSNGGALGRGCGPLLLGGRYCESEFDPAGVLYVPGEFTTANFLLDYFLSQAVGKHFLAFDELYERLLKEPKSQGVVIHEKRFTYHRDGLKLFRDLGAYWEDETGFPIPLGAIALSRERADEREALQKLIRESLEWARAHEDEALEVCRRYAQDLAPEVMRAHIELYVNDYTLDLGDTGEAAVQHFLKLQREFFASPRQ